MPLNLQAVSELLDHLAPAHSTHPRSPRNPFLSRASLVRSPEGRLPECSEEGLLRTTLDGVTVAWGNVT